MLNRSQNNAGARSFGAAGGLLLAVCGLAGCGEFMSLYLPPSPVQIAAFVPPADWPTPPPVRGANLVGFSNRAFDDAAPLAAALADFSARGGNWLAVNFWWFQDDAHAAEISPDPARYTVSDAALSAAVAAARAQGFRVVLRPLVDVRAGASRTEIVPSAAWFASYRAYVLRYAELAAEWRVDAFSLGAELSQTQGWDAAWRALAADVRARFTGTLVYSANFDALELPWWDAVDVVGVDAYYPLTGTAAPDVAELTGAWQYWLATLRRDLLRFAGDRPVWLTEVGLRAVRGAPRAPWRASDAGADALDVQVQADFYRALLRAAGSNAWVTGLFWWCWYPDPTVAPATDFTPQNKPAAAVLAELWGIFGR